MEEKNNPLSPHLQIYRWQISSLLSITHRIVGVINFFAIILICFWVILITFSQNNYSSINDKRQIDDHCVWANGSDILSHFTCNFDFENEVISSCVGYIKMWKETKGEMCEKAFKRLNGIMNLMNILGSSEYKSSFIEVSKKIDKLKLNKLQNETEKNSS